MAHQPNDPDRSNMTEEEIRHQARLNNLDNDLQPDPELAEGPASGAKIAMFAIAIAVVLAAIAERAEPAGQPRISTGHAEGQHRTRHDDGRGNQPPDPAAVQSDRPGGRPFEDA